MKTPSSPPPASGCLTAVLAAGYLLSACAGGPRGTYEDALNAADTAQVHYLALMFPDAEGKSTLARIYGKNPVYLGNYLPSRSAGRTAEAETEFWSAARKSSDLDAAWWPGAVHTADE